MALAQDITTPEIHDLGVELVDTERGLALVGDGMEIVADLSRLLPRIKPSNLQQELLVRAAKVKGLDREPLVIDATAGFGEDALLLAAAGCSVIMFEHNPIIAALLRDALVRAVDEPQLASVVSRLTLVEGDSVQELRNRACPAESGEAALSPDVVYLDPMFPERSKSAAVKKKFQLLHRIEMPCSDEHELLDAAFACQPRKIVIKRTLKGPYLADRKPHYSLKGKAVRYDCFAFASR